MSKPALQKAAMVWKSPRPSDPNPCPSTANRIVRATAPTSSTRRVMSATWPMRRATLRGESGLASSSRTIRSSLNPMRRPMSSAPTVAAVMIPRPPSCIRPARIPCPSGVKSSAGTTACNPVTVTALTDSKKASVQLMPLLAAGILSSRVPTTMSPAKARTMRRGAERRGAESRGSTSPSSSSAADVDGRAPLCVRLRLPQDLVGDGCRVALAEEEVAEQVHDRVALRPAEVAVRGPPGCVAQVEQECCDRVWDHRAHGAQHLVAADLHAPHLQHVLELRGVLDVHLEEQDRLPGRDVVVITLLPLLAGVLLRIVARATPVGDDVDVAPLGCLVYKALGRLVDLYARLPELERAVDAGDQRRGDDGDHEEGGDHEPVGPLYLVGDQGIDEDGCYQAEGHRAAPRPPAV